MDERLTEEQIQAEQERLNAIRDGTAGHVELNKELELMKSALGAVTKVAKDYTKQMADGEHGAKQFKGAIDLAGAAADGVVAGLTGLALMLAPLTAGMSLLILGVGAAASGAVKLGKEWAKASTDQADALFKTYQDLNKIGAAGSAGMTGIFRDMQNFGYNVKQLDQMVALIAQNSDTLAKFGGIASVGTKRFAQLSNEVRDSEVGRKLLYAGNTVDDLNQAEVTYLKTLTNLGVQRTKTDKELIAGASALADNFDLLRRVTGETLADQARKLVDLTQQDIAGQVFADLETAGEQGVKDAQQIQTFLLALPKDIREMLARAMGGRVLPQDARLFSQIADTATQLMAKARGELPEVGAEQLYDTLRKDLGKTMDMSGRAFRLGIGKDIAGVYRKDIVAITGAGSLEERMAQAKKDQDLRDKTTDGMVNLNLTQMDATRALDTLVNVGINPTITALQGLAEAATAAYEAPGSMIDRLKPPGGSKLGDRIGGPGGGQTLYKNAFDVLFGRRPREYGPLPPGVNALLETISRGEGTTNAIAKEKGYKSGYDVTLGYGAYGGGPNEKPLTEMTLAEVKELQRKMLAHPSNKFNSSAVGRYQIVGKTLRGLQAEMGLQDTEKFTADLQDRMAKQLLQQAGLGGYVSGKISAGQLQNNLAQVWASIQTADTGRGYYANQRNAAVDTAMVKRALDQLGVPTPGEASPAAGKAVPIDTTAKPVTKPAGPIQSYSSAIKDIKPEAKPETKPDITTPNVEVQQAVNQKFFEMMQQQNSTFDSMLALQRRTANNTGKIVQQSK